MALWKKAFFEPGSVGLYITFQMAAERRHNNRGELHPSEYCWLNGGNVF